MRSEVFAPLNKVGFIPPGGQGCRDEIWYGRLHAMRFAD
jgi:hypothetical protein